jgi:hypothetical protein
MSRTCRGNYVLVTYAGDHAPRHVHVYLDNRLVLRRDLDDWRPIFGLATRRIRRYLEELACEGRI